MIVMPLFHVAGSNVSFSGLAQGGRLVLVKDFAADDAVRMLTEERVAPVSYTHLRARLGRDRLGTLGRERGCHDRASRHRLGRGAIEGRQLYPLRTDGEVERDAADRGLSLIHI